MRPLRVLTFLHSFEPGGVERVALRLVRAWQDAGIDAPLLMGRATGVERDRTAHPRWSAPVQPMFGTWWWETLWMVLILPFSIVRDRPNLLFCAGNSYTVVAVAMKLLLGPVCPPIVAKISNDLERRDLILPVRWLYRLWLKVQGALIDHFVVTEASLAASTADALGIDARCITTIPNPVLSMERIRRMRALRRSSPSRPGGRNFVAAGRLVPQKNYPLMLRAFARGAGPGDRLRIYGTGRMRPELERQIAAMGLGGRVSLAGHVASIDPILPVHDVLLLSSAYEGTPGVVIEALAAGLAIVATDCSAAMRPLLHGGLLGDIVPTGDEIAFARAILTARFDGQDAEASLAQAHNFCVERAARQFLGCFEKVTAAHHDIGSWPAVVRPAQRYGENPR